MMSVASSTTPGMGENSCSTPSIFTAENAAPLDRGQQHPPHGVADGRAESPLERLGVEAAEPLVQGVTLELQPLWPLETLP